jgi:hypothetical protein
VQKGETGKAEKVSLLDHYKPLTPIPPYRLSVPTRGIYAEAVIGSCNSCEEVQERTSQDWDKFGTEQPTGINNLTPPTVVATDWKAVFKELAAPVLSLQQAPAAPAPGAGAAGITDALTKAGVFKDITGLEKNQTSASETYKINSENAVKFAEMAKAVLGQSHNTMNSEKIMGNLKAARMDGGLSDDEYSRLVKRHLEQQIDGGDAARRKEKSEQKAAEAKTEKPTLSDAAVKALDQGKDVKAVEVDKKGATRSVEIKPNRPASDVLPPRVKKFYKTIVLKVIDGFGERMMAEFSLYVFDLVSNQEVGYELFDQGSGTLRVGFTTAAPTVQIAVAALAQPDAPSPILTNRRFESDPVIIPEAQAAVTVTLRQLSTKVTIQTKDTTLTGEKVYKELSSELSAGGSGKGSEKDGDRGAFEINLSLATKIAGKYSTEVTTTTGHEEGKTFEVIVPVDRYELTVK